MGKTVIVEEKASNFSSGTSADSFGVGNNTANKTYYKSFQPDFDPYIAYDPVLQTWVRRDSEASVEIPFADATASEEENFVATEIGFHHTNQKPLTPAYGLDAITNLVDSGLSVVKVSTTAGANNHDKLIAAIASASAGDIVWVDIASFAETFDGGELVINTPIHLVGYNGDPAETIITMGTGTVGASQSCLRLNVGGTGPLWKDRVVISGITIDGAGINTTDDGINVTGFHAVLVDKSYVTYENCVAKNCYGFGFNLESVSTTTDFVFKDCVASYCAHGFKAGGGTVEDMKILNCVAHDNRHHPSSSGTTGSGFFIRPLLIRFIMKDCASISNQEHGFSTEQFTCDSLVENCLFEGNGWDINAFNPSGCKISQGDGEEVDGLTFKRCVFRHNGLRAPFTDTDGNDRGIGVLFKVKTATSKDVLFEECTFDNNGHIGIHWHGRDGEAPTTSNFVVKDCNFYNHEFAGLGMDNLGSTENQIITATGNYWGSTDGASGTGPGTGDATLTSTPYGAKRVANEGETLQTSIIVLTID